MRPCRALPHRLWLLLVVCGAAPAVELACVTVDTPPVLDGVLDDVCWQAAPQVTEFYFPRDNRAGSELTEAWVCFGPSHLYVAFYAHDSRPDQIFAQQTQRGGGLERDDFVAVWIDARRQYGELYRFEVNPLGTQDDRIPQSGSGNLVWRGDWDAAAQRVDDGFIVEMAIPYRIFIYPTGQSSIGISFARNYERREEMWFWPVMRDRFESQQMAAIHGVPLPAPRTRPAILPYSIFRVGEDGTTIQSGIDLKHVFPAGVTGMLTLNPDFRNIEDVVETIAFSDTARFLDESRPFFREGDDYFPGGRALYTRSIPDVIFGLKSFGRVGDHSMGVLGSLSDHGRTDAALQYGYAFTPYVGAAAALVTTDQSGRPDNSVATLGFNGWQPMGRVGMWFGGAMNHSFTAGPGGEGNDYGFSTGVEWENTLSASFSYGETQPDYTALLGFVPERDARGINARLNVGHENQDRFIQNYGLGVGYVDRWKRDGSLLQSAWSLSGGLRFANGTRIGLDWFRQNRPPHRDQVVGGNFQWGLDSLHNNGAIGLSYGDRGGANDFFLTFNQNLAVTRQLRFGWRSEVSNRRPFDPMVPGRFVTQNIVTGTWEFGPYSSASARLVERDGDLNLFVAYRIQPRSGRTVLLMFGDPNTARTQAQFQAKLIWPL